MKTRLFLAAGLAVLVALAVIWWRNNFERVEVKERVGASGEARLRQFLAAERFAQRMGWSASELRSLPELDTLPASGVLVLPNRRQALHPGRLGALAGWVEKGGHLIAEAEYGGVADPLLDLLGVKRIDVPYAGKPMRVELPRTGRTLTVFLPGTYGLAVPGGDVRLNVGQKLVSFGKGRGVVTVATSLHFARNQAIGSHDHAELFWHLMTLTPGRDLRVYWAPGRLSLWGSLKENAAPALAASVLVLALWLWSIVPRFGPVTPDAPPGRRRLLDHLRASGRYYWTKGLRARLVVAARDAALRRIARVQPDFAAAAEGERISRLSALAGISKEEAHRFIAAGGAMRGADFIKLAQHAQRIHSALEKGSKK